MAYLWDYVYYNEALAIPIWEKELESEDDNPITPYQPIVIDDGDLRGVYFIAVTNRNDLYVWKWDWMNQFLSERIFPNWQSVFSNPFLFRPLSFVSSDYQRAFIVLSSWGYGYTYFAELTPTLSAGLPPTYLGSKYGGSIALQNSKVGYAGDATFVLETSPTGDVRVFSWDNDFPEFTLTRRIIPHQHASKLTRPLILFGRSPTGGINAEALPLILYSDGSTKATSELDLPSSMATGSFVAALGPQFCGYDFFIWNLPTNWNIKTNFDVRLLDWVKDETSWIFIKQANLTSIETPPEISLLLDGTNVIKHVSAASEGALIAVHTYRYLSGYSYSYLTLQNTLIFGDAATSTAHLCILTPIGTAYIPDTPPQAAIISPATFHFERGCWYATVTYENKIAFFQIIHPQFFSKYFASIPAIETISTDEKHVIFVGKVTPRYPRQHWKLAIVAMQDSNLQETVASTKERVTNWEIWEVSYNGTDWTELPAGSYLEGNQWVRVKVPKSILEWKKDVFEQRYPNRKWRLAFISEPIT